MDKEAFSRDRPGKSSNLGEKLNTEGKAKKVASAKLHSETTAQKAAGEKMRFEKAAFEPEGEKAVKGLRPKQQKRYAKKKPAPSRAAQLAEGKVRSEIDQNSDDNVGIEAANAGTQAGRLQPALRGIRHPVPSLAGVRSRRSRRSMRLPKQEKLLADRQDMHPVPERRPAEHRPKVQERPPKKRRTSWKGWRNSSPLTAI
jgi:hypothetical protein